MSELAERRSSETAVVNIHVDQDAPQQFQAAPFQAAPAQFSSYPAEVSYPASFSSYAAPMPGPVYTETYATAAPAFVPPAITSTTYATATPAYFPAPAPVVAPIAAPIRPYRRGCCILDDQRYAAIKQNKSFQPLAAFLTFVSLVLFIIAIANEEWVTFDAVVLNNGSGNWVTGSSRRGLWSACFIPQETNLLAPAAAITARDATCTDIDNDGEALITIYGNTFDFSEYRVQREVGAFGSNRKFNAVRAFMFLAIFFAFGAWIAQLIASWKTAARGQNYLTQQWVGIVFGFLAAIWGMIAMAIARSYYGDLAQHQYGSCFWLTVIAWPIIFLSTILFMWPTSRVLPWAGFASILTLIAFTFFIVSIASNEMVYYTRSYVDRVFSNNTATLATTDPVPARVRTDSITVGLWKYCTKLAGQSEAYCNDIDNQCDLDNGATLGMCSQYRAIRAFLILAIIFSFIAFIGQVIYQCNPKFKPHLGGLAAMAAAASGYIATTLSVDWYVAPASFYGYSFWLQLVAWAFMLIAAPLTYLTWWDHRVRWQAIATYFAFVAFIFFVTAVSTTQWTVIQSRDLPLFADGWTRGRIPAQYGLWRMCLNFQCYDIETSTTCGVDFGLLPDYRDCHKFNAIRAFALLATIFGFFWFIFQYCAARGLSLRIRDAEADIVRSRNAAANQGIIVKVPETVPENTPWLAVTFGILTFIFATIAIAVHRSYYDLYSRDYGQSFYLFLTAFLLVFIFTIMSMRNYYSDRHQALGALVTTIAFIFFIIATVDPHFYRIDIPFPASPLVVGGSSRENDLQNLAFSNDRYSDRIGLFHRCFKTGNDHKCWRIDKDCNFGNYPDALASCNRFQTVRAFAVLACIFAGLAWLLMIFHAPCFKRQLWWTRLWGAVFAWMASIFGLIAMAVAISYFDNFPITYLDYSFWLLTIAWPLVFFAGFIFYYSFYNPKPIAPPKAPKYKFVAPAAAPAFYGGYAPVAPPLAAPTVAVATNYAGY